MMSNKIYIGSDHGGFELKKKIILFLKKKGFTVEDKGPFTLDKNDDYADYVIPVARSVAESKDSLGIVLCRNGQGVCIATNKVKGIRAVTGFSKSMVASTKNDDNANILCIPADYVSEKEVEEMVELWIKIPFSHEERHIRRLNKIKKLEK